MIELVLLATILWLAIITQGQSKKEEQLRTKLFELDNEAKLFFLDKKQLENEIRDKEYIIQQQETDINEFNTMLKRKDTDYKRSMTCAIKRFEKDVKDIKSYYINFEALKQTIKLSNYSKSTQQMLCAYVDRLEEEYTINLKKLKKMKWIKK